MVNAARHVDGNVDLYQQHGTVYHCQFALVTVDVL